MTTGSRLEGSAADIIGGMKEMDRAPELRRIAELPIEERADALEDLVELLELDLERTRPAGEDNPEPAST